MTLFKYSMKQALKSLVIILSIMIILFFGYQNTLVLNAEESTETTESVESTEYSNVLEDLKRDKNFNLNTYPGKDNDYALYVIQIAESNNDELFVYAYQPSHYSHDLIATSITISNSLNEDGNENYVNYELTLVSSSGVFDKYLVNGIEINKTLNERYYEITSIFREPDVLVDNLPAGYEIEELAMSVAQRWYVKDTEDSVSYSCDTIETITITAQYPGYVRYNNGYYLWSGHDYVDGYYYAFDTDRLIENLLEVEMIYDVDYSRIEYDGISLVPEKDENKTTTRSTLRYDEYAETSGGLFAPKRTWKRIMLVDDFISYVEDEQGLSLRNQVKENLSTCKWVINFAEFRYYSWTDETSSSLLPASIVEQRSVSNIQPIRFKFITDGVTYNLGVIGDKVATDNQPSNENTTSPEALKEWFEQSLGVASEWFEKVIMLIGILILLVILGYCVPVFKVIFKVIIKCITWIFKGLWLIICSPFQLIGKLFKPSKRKR